MGLIATEGGGSNFEPVSEGLHQAVCYSVYDLGTHYNEKFSKSSHQILIMWELPGERIDIEKNGEKLNLPRAISKKYTLSLGEKANLRKDLQTWRGRAFSAVELKGFDLHKLLGVGCQIQIIHNKKDDKTYANITAIMPMPKGSQPLKAENPLRFYSISDHGQNIPEGTPEWVTEIIKDSDEWPTLKPATAGESPDSFNPEEWPQETTQAPPAAETNMKGWDKAPEPKSPPAGAQEVQQGHWTTCPDGQERVCNGICAIGKKKEDCDKLVI